MTAPRQMAEPDSKPAQMKSANLLKSPFANVPQFGVPVVIRHNEWFAADF